MQLLYFKITSTSASKQVDSSRGEDAVICRYMCRLPHSRMPHIAYDVGLMAEYNTRHGCGRDSSRLSRRWSVGHPSWFSKTYLPANLPVYLSNYLSIFLHTFLPTYVGICMYLYASVSVSIPKYTPTYIYIYLHTLTYTYIHLHSPTYLHINRCMPDRQIDKNLTDFPEKFR